MTLNFNAWWIINDEFYTVVTPKTHLPIIGDVCKVRVVRQALNVVTIAVQVAQATNNLVILRQGTALTAPVVVKTYTCPNFSCLTAEGFGLPESVTWGVADYSMPTGTVLTVPPEFMNRVNGKTGALLIKWTGVPSSGVEVPTHYAPTGANYEDQFWSGDILWEDAPRPFLYTINFPNFYNLGHNCWAKFGPYPSPGGSFSKTFSTTNMSSRRGVFLIYYRYGNAYLYGSPNTWAMSFRLTVYSNNVQLYQGPWIDQWSNPGLVNPGYLTHSGGEISIKIETYAVGTDNWIMMGLNLFFFPEGYLWPLTMETALLHNSRKVMKKTATGSDNIDTRKFQAGYDYDPIQFTSKSNGKIKSLSVEFIEDTAYSRQWDICEDPTNVGDYTTLVRFYEKLEAFNWTAGPQSVAGGSSVNLPTANQTQTVGSSGVIVARWTGTTNPVVNLGSREAGIGTGLVTTIAYAVSGSGTLLVNYNAKEYTDLFEILINGSVVRDSYYQGNPVNSGTLDYYYSGSGSVSLRITSTDDRVNKQWIAVTQQYWGTFQNAYAVWITDDGSTPSHITQVNFIARYQFTVGTSATYTVQGACDDLGGYRIDGGDFYDQSGRFDGVSEPFSNSVYLTAGTHIIDISCFNAGELGWDGINNPAGIAIRITSAAGTQIFSTRDISKQIPYVDWAVSASFTPDPPVMLINILEDGVVVSSSPYTQDGAEIDYLKAVKTSKLSVQFTAKNSASYTMNVEYQGLSAGQWLFDTFSKTALTQAIELSVPHKAPALISIAPAVARKQTNYNIVSQDHVISLQDANITSFTSIKVEIFTSYEKIGGIIYSTDTQRLLRTVSYTPEMLWEELGVLWDSWETAWGLDGGVISQSSYVYTTALQTTDGGPFPKYVVRRTVVYPAEEGTNLTQIIEYTASNSYSLYVPASATYEADVVGVNSTNSYNIDMTPASASSVVAGQIVGSITPAVGAFQTYSYSRALQISVQSQGERLIQQIDLADQYPVKWQATNTQTILYPEAFINALTSAACVRDDGYIELLGTSASGLATISRRKVTIWNWLSELPWEEWELPWGDEVPPEIDIIQLQQNIGTVYRGVYCPVTDEVVFLVDIYDVEGPGYRLALIRMDRIALNGDLYDAVIFLDDDLSETPSSPYYADIAMVNTAKAVVVYKQKSTGQAMMVIVDLTLNQPLS